MKLFLLAFLHKTKKCNTIEKFFALLKKTDESYILIMDYKQIKQTPIQNIFSQKKIHTTKYKF